MIPLKTLRELFGYNYWARDRQLEACRVLTEEQFLRPMGNSFSSVRDTLAHLVASEWVWLQRWKGRSPTRADADVKELAAENFPTLESIQRRWLAVERDLRAYLAGLPEQALGQSLTYVNLAGQTWTYPLWCTLLHVVNHQTYHRGQVTTLLRQLGVPAVALDFLVARDSGLAR
jgi:uncharacterized damage-inducible protein DinB